MSPSSGDDRRGTPRAPLDDRAVVAAICAGDEGAFDTLYRATADALWSFARQFVAEPDLARDAVHDVYATVWANRQTWAPGDSVRAYLFRAVRNRALSAIRHDAVVRRAEQAIGAADEIAGMGTASPSPDASALTNDARAALSRMVDTLPERQRAALLLWWHEELSLGEIAHVLEVSLPAAHKLLAKAQARLLGAAEPS